MSGTTVTRIRRSPGGHDKYGDPVPSSATATPITGCAIAPRTDPEPTERGRNGVIVGLTLYAPPGTDLVHTDLIQLNPDDPDDLYEIEGEPGIWANPWVPSHGGVEAALKRAAG